MNKEEALQLIKAKQNEDLREGSFPAIAVTHDALLAFAQACEKIGMEKAAKICDEKSSNEWQKIGSYICAEAIRKAI